MTRHEFDDICTQVILKRWKSISSNELDMLYGQISGVDVAHFKTAAGVIVFERETTRRPPMRAFTDQTFKEQRYAVNAQYAHAETNDPPAPPGMYAILKRFTAAMFALPYGPESNAMRVQHTKEYIQAMDAGGFFLSASILKMHTDNIDRWEDAA